MAKATGGKPASSGFMASILGDCSGGLTAALLAIPGNMVCGLIAFAPLGPAYSKYGIIAGLLASVFTAFAAGALGSIRTMITGPQVSTAIIFASLLERLAATRRFAVDKPEDVTILLALAFGSVLLSGLMQVLLSVFRAGKLIRYVPYPVVAAVFDSTALVIVIGQLRPFVKLGLGFSWLNQPASAVIARLGQFDAFQLEMTLFTFLSCLLVGILLKKLPSPLIALILGSAAYYAIEYEWFHDRFAAAFARVQPTAMRFDFDILRSYPALAGERYRDLFGLVGYAALSIAVIGSLDTLFAGTSLAGALGKRHKGNRDLLGQGIGNMVGAFMGAIPGEGFLTRSLVNREAGGRSLLSVGVYAGSTFLVVYFLNGYLPLIPKAVVSGIMLHTALRLVDRWSIGLVGRLFTSKWRYKKEIALNLLVVAAVVATTLAFDLISGVFAGLVLSIATFFGQMNEDIIRRAYTGGTVHSMKSRSRRCANLLQRHGGRIAVLELEGALFFGSAVAVAERVESLAEAELRFVVLDCRRLSRVDASGVKMLQSMAQGLARRNASLLLCSITATGGMYLFRNDVKALSGVSNGRVRIFPDAELALEYAEDRILEEHVEEEAPEAELGLAECLRAMGLEGGRAEGLEAYFEVMRLERDDLVYQEGSKGGSLYLLASGSAEETIAVPGRRRRKRVAAYSPGTLFAEASLLGGGTHGSSVRALEDSTCYRLSKARFEAMRKAAPDLAFQLLILIGKTSAASLRNAYDVIADLERG